MSKLSYRLVKYFSLYFVHFSHFLGLMFSKYEPKSKQMIDSDKYSILIVLTIILITPLTIQELYRQELVRTEFVITKVLQTFSFDMLTHFSVMVALYWTVLFKSSQCKELINKALELYREILRINRTQVFQRDRKLFVCIIIQLLIGYYSVCLICYRYSVNADFNSEKPWIKFVIFINILFVIFVNTQVSVIFLSVVLFTAHSLRLVNSQIKECILIIQRSPKISESCQLSDRLDDLHITHAKIMEFMQQVMQFYSLPLFIKFTMRFISSVALVSLFQN